MNTHKLLLATQFIEQDGIDGFQTAQGLVGRKMAIMLIALHVRRQLSEKHGFGSTVIVNEELLFFLKKHNLLEINAFRGEFRFLSNFWLVDVIYEDMQYPSVEHAFQAAMTLDGAMREKISFLGTSYDAKNESKKETFPRRSDWKDIRLSVMDSLLKQKFHPDKNPELSFRLYETGDMKLIEGNTWDDNYWGVCNGIGENNLGLLLTERRNDISAFVKHYVDRSPMNEDGIFAFKGVPLSEPNTYRWKQMFSLTN